MVQFYYNNLQNNCILNILEESGHAMYHVAICDDEITICSQLEQIILEYGKLTSEKMEVDMYYSGEKLYKALTDGIFYDMVFLDIKLKLLNGVELGKKIRDDLKNEFIHIVYISGESSYAMQLFKVRPMDFLIKPLNAHIIGAVLKKGMELSNRICQYFNYQQGHSAKRALIKDILYFESINRQVKMVTVAQDIIFYGALSEIFLQLEKYRFFYIHKSFLVNYNHVIEFNYEQLVMSNKAVLPISQSRRKNVRELQLKLEEANF